MTDTFEAKHKKILFPLPYPSPPDQTPVYPQNLASLNIGRLILLYTQYAQLVAYTVAETAKIEIDAISVKDEYDREVILRFVHSEAKSTTERKERAKASKKVMGLSSSLSLINQDLTVLRALSDSYKTLYFSIKSEIERRKYE